MNRRLVALWFVGFTWAGTLPPPSVLAQGTQSYEQITATLIEGAKRKQGTLDQEQALQGQLEGRVDPSADASSDNKVLISAKDKAANPYYNMVINGKSDIKTCTLDRTVNIYTGQHLKEIQGDFWLKGIAFRDDLRRCNVERKYIPYQITVNDPPVVQTQTVIWQSVTRKHDVGSSRKKTVTVWTDEAGNACGKQPAVGGSSSIPSLPTIPWGDKTTCLNGIASRRSCPGGTLTYKGTNNTRVPVNYPATVVKISSSWTCTIPRNHQETRLRETIDDRCASIASCTLLEDTADAGGCRNISGVVVCPPWWVRNRLYSCHQNHECSAWPTSEEECGTWFSPNMAGCKASMYTGLQAIALRKFRQIEGNLNCTQFSMNETAPGSLSSAGPFYHGCGIFQPSRTDQFRFLSSAQTRLAASCVLADQPLPPGVLDQRLNLQAVPGQMKVRYLTYDYHTESVVDGCNRMTADFAKQGVVCELMDEFADGVQTYSGGVPLLRQPPVSCEKFNGTLQTYEFCREFWNKQRKYRCRTRPVDPRATNRRIAPGLTPTTEPTGGIDAPGFDTALGSLAVVNELAKTTSTDRTCANPNPDGSCNQDQVRLFGGGTNKCVQWSPMLQSINYTCCKSGLQAQCDAGGFCLDFCTQADIATSTNVDKNVCQKTGTYCSNRQCIGATVNGQCIGFWQCLEKKTSYCCFDSVLGKLLQQQGRIQLGKGWGSPDAPNCSGLTINEFTKLDLSKMDLSEFINSIVPDPKALSGSGIDPAAIQSQIKQSVLGTNYAAP